MSVAHIAHNYFAIGGGRGTWNLVISQRMRHNRSTMDFLCTFKFRNLFFFFFFGLFAFPSYESITSVLLIKFIHLRGIYCTLTMCKALGSVQD